MNDLAIIFGGTLGAFLDPIKVIVVLPTVIMLLERKWPVWLVIPTSALIGGFAGEALMTFVQITRSFGQGIIFQVLASLIMSFISVWLARKYFIKSETH